MVHALREIHRVLASGGVLIDVRPLLDQWPVEVSWAGGYREVGKVTDLREPLADDVAANAAMNEADAGIGFAREREAAYSFSYYWDTPKEMQNYIAESWDDVISIDEGVWNSLGSARASAGAEARVRMRMKLVIARHRKLA